MTNEKTSLFSNSLLWFGAAVSIAEIITGALIAPLGFLKGFYAIILGHLIGCTLLYFAGLIGAESGLPAMESSRISFGRQGSYLFSALNILQLIGWTAVMIIGGAKALSVIIKSLTGYENELLWCVMIGALIILWIMIGIKNLGKVNIFAVGGLFLLTIILSTVVFKGTAGSNPIEGAMSFGMAVELSAAMPLSWLPLISDYTRNAQKPQKAALVSTISYFLGSSWMYIIGLGAAIFVGNSDITQILMSAGFVIVPMLIVLMSTVTTTFLDAYSAGVSFTNINKKVDEKYCAIIISIIGTLIAMFTPIEQYENFLYLIGSVFAPMIAILITDFFILKNRNIDQSINVLNILVWVAGFITYRVFMSIDTVIGSTLPVMIVVSIIFILVNGGKKLCLKRF